jgi:hypothetical protein
MEREEIEYLYAFDSDFAVRFTEYWHRRPRLAVWRRSHRRGDRIARTRWAGERQHDRPSGLAGRSPVLPVMSWQCETCGETWEKHPVLAVPCPTCRVRAGAWCRRPSGHRAMALHVAREQAALDSGILHRCPAAATQLEMQL